MGPRMADTDNVVSMIQAQVKRNPDVIRDLARRAGVRYAIWAEVKTIMRDHQIDRVELAEFLAKGEIRDAWVMSGVTRYRIGSEDPDLRITSATVAIHNEVVTIEVIALVPADDTVLQTAS